MFFQMSKIQSFFPKLSYSSMKKWMNKKSTKQVNVGANFLWEKQTKRLPPTNSCENDFINEKMTFPKKKGIK